MSFRSKAAVILAMGFVATSGGIAAPLHHDGTLDDVCALYGWPYPIGWFSYLYTYIPENLLLGVGLTGTGATATEPSSWGRVKVLFE